MKHVTCDITRYDPAKDARPRIERHEAPFTPGMRVLDALIHIQERRAGDLAFRWNCGEGICGSCAMEVNGKAVLACKEEIMPDTGVLRIAPMKVFPVIKDLVPDTAGAYKALAPFKPWFIGKQPGTDGFYTIHNEESRAAAEFKKCIDCFICTDTCHVRRNHGRAEFIGPAGLVRLASFDQHPRSAYERAPHLASAHIDLCNVTRCCQAACPQGIRITENAIIPAKERLITALGPFRKRLKVVE